MPAEFIRGAAIGDRFGDEVGLADHSPALLFLPCNRADCEYISFCDFLRLPPFAAGLALAEEMPSSIPDRMAPEVLHIEQAVVESDTVNRAVWAVFDHFGLSVGEPLAEIEALRTKQSGCPAGAALPAIGCVSSLNERVHRSGRVAGEVGNQRQR